MLRSFACVGVASVVVVAVVFDCGDLVLSLVVANHVDFVLAGKHQGYNLAWSPHKRLAEALDLDLTGWVNMPELDRSSDLLLVSLFFLLQVFRLKVLGDHGFLGFLGSKFSLLLLALILFLLFGPDHSSSLSI